ncbi:homoserine kinase [Thermoleptolyngbya sp. C42_A2020_037]|uniref:homoserine kinase n=1 Tax=Thermoleptolyngbya sp. C42_A2020_037 TaxID=2747799 RepID=UPI0019E89ADB|nr:homoserine kinase [Thermoleptolyngbya sp. C42_A2020_037]MBF2083298.1 homoserine kinase [Thermoleptolyngbya sp. C42_A2020_037]
MTLPEHAIVSVPATTTNIGPGFDCLGAALSLRNHFTFTRLDQSIEPVQISVSGLEAARVKTNETNLAYQAFSRLFHHLKQSPPLIKLEIRLGVPLARGLGSSATAIVGGLVGANVLAGSPLSEAELVAIAVEMEGHPDNVVPALLGGCRLAATDLNGEWAIAPVAWHSDIVPVAAIPDFELSTAEARRVLPTEYSRADAVFNMGHLGLLLRGLEAANPNWLRAALQDRVHQPYRRLLIPGFDAVEAAAVAAGAYGLVISGAGPTLLALAHADIAPLVAEAMKAAWEDQGISLQAQALHLDPTGVSVQG